MKEDPFDTEPAGKSNFRVIVVLVVVVLGGGMGFVLSRGGLSFAPVREDQTAPPAAVKPAPSAPAVDARTNRPPDAVTDPAAVPVPQVKPEKAPDKIEKMAAGIDRLQDEIGKLRNQTTALDDRLSNLSSQSARTNSSGVDYLNIVWTLLFIALFGAFWFLWSALRDVFGDLREELHQRFNTLENELNGLRALCDAMARELRPRDPAETLGGKAKIAHPPSEPAFGYQAPLAYGQSPFQATRAPLGLTELYNHAWEDREEEATFRNQYPGFFIGVVNDIERARNPGLGAKFGEEERGDFYAFESRGGGGLYSVVPRFGRAPTRDRLVGAWRELFDCQSDTGRTAQTVRLDEVAVLRRNGDSWELVKRGRISAI